MRLQLVCRLSSRRRGCNQGQNSSDLTGASWQRRRASLGLLKLSHLAGIAASVQSRCITICETEVAQPAIIPAAKALYLCDGCIGFPNQKTDLIGLFNSIRPMKYPHVQSQFVVFAQLLGGLGQVPSY